jgi:transposase
MRPIGSPEKLEARRLIAAEMFADGVRPAEVGRRLHVSRQTASVWHAAYIQSGEAGLKAVRHPGPARRLTQEQAEKLQELLLLGAKEHGFGTNVWTRQRVAEVIRREFGIEYHTDHISRVLAWLGWTCQKPEKQARERNDEAVEAWKKKDWVRIKKKPLAPKRRSASSTSRESRKSLRLAEPGRRKAKRRS